MRTLLLLRHAKSSWADPQLEDFERPLNSRGLEATSALAAHFFVTKLQPDLVLCSAALRTRATLAGLLPAFAHDYRVSVENRLYLASAPKLLERLHEIDEAAACVLLIGHNPGLERLARLLAGSGIAGKDRGDAQQISDRGTCDLRIRSAQAGGTSAKDPASSPIIAFPPISKTNSSLPEPAAPGERSPSARRPAPPCRGRRRPGGAPRRNARSAKPDSSPPPAKA